MKQDIETQKHYEGKKSAFEEKISLLRKKEPEILAKARASTSTAAPLLFGISNDMLDIASNYMAINSIYRSLFNLRDEEALSEARNAISKAIIYMENVVSGRVDVPFSDYEDKLAELNAVSPEKKYFFMRKMGLAIALLKQSYGENSKWRWSFVDIEGRYTAVAKNLLDLKRLYAAQGLSSDEGDALRRHFSLLKTLLAVQASRFQERFSLSSKKNIEDLRYAISFLNALRQIHAAINERREAEDVKKKINALNSMHDAEMLKGKRD